MLQVGFGYTQYIDKRRPDVSGVPNRVAPQVSIIIGGSGIAATSNVSEMKLHALTYLLHLLKLQHFFEMQLPTCLLTLEITAFLRNATFAAPIAAPIAARVLGNKLFGDTKLAANTTDKTSMMMPMLVHKVNSITVVKLQYVVTILR